MDFSRWGSSIGRLTQRTQAVFNRVTATDLRVTALLIVLAMLTRLPFLFHPLSNISDEFLYADFAMLVASGTPMFDIHPPLVRILFSFIIAPFQFSGFLFPIDVVPFGDFPFQALRAFVSVFGILLPVVMYAIGRLTKLSRAQSLLIGLFVIFDNALTLYGGIFIPDTILLFSNMSALAGVLFAVHASTEKRSWTFVVLGSLMWGLALSIKWTALGMLPVIGLILLFMMKRGIWKLLTFLFLSLVIYLAIFSYYFTLFTPVDRPPLTIVEYYTGITQDVRFPDSKSLNEILPYVYHTHLLMMKANTDESVIDTFNRNVPAPILWPLGQTATLYWWDPEDHNTVIYLMGNLVLWTMLFFVFLFGLLRAMKGIWRGPTSYFQREMLPLLFIVGYLANFLPFFFISRPMYLYHYFTALLFLMLLAPHVFPHIAKTAEQKFNDPLFVKVFSTAVLIAIFVSFLVGLPVTYGW